MIMLEALAKLENISLEELDLTVELISSFLSLVLFLLII